MKRWKQKLEALVMAVTYAEASDWQSARSFLRESARQSEQQTKKSLKKRQQERQRPRIYRS